jgi:hypothetical protein
MADPRAALTITLIKSTRPARVCKVYTLLDDGKLDKHGVANITEGVAQSYIAEDADQAATLLAKATASNDLTFVLGRWRGDDGTPFEIVTKATLAEMFCVAEDDCPVGVVEYEGRRVAARLADGIDPSSWILLDADNSPGMPADWAAMSIQQRLEFWEPVMPGISRATCVELRASSARVVKNGEPEKEASHALLRVSDANKIALMKAYVGIEMVNRGLSFPFEKRSRVDRSRIVGIEHRSVFDTSVWNQGRLVFCAKPDITTAPGYRLDDADVRIIDGTEVLDLSFVKKPDPAALRNYSLKTGIALALKISATGSLSVISRGELTLDTEIEARGVVKTLHDWIASMKRGDKLRCEAPFRQSASEAAFIRIGNDGQPFVHDSGNGVTYRLAMPGDDIVDEFNDRYMVVNEGGRTVVYEQAYDIVLGRPHYITFTFVDFQRLYLNQQIINGYNAKGIAKYMDAGSFWLKHARRRQYLGGVVFDPSGRADRPDVLNLWRGFSVEARQGGSWAMLRDHILTIICDGNREHFDYLMRWLARLVQYPAQQGEVAVVLRGGEGTGKGTLANALRLIFGAHGLAVSNPEHLIGRFNGHLRDVVFLFADEAFYAGNKAHVGALKSLITEPRLPIEAKYKNTVEAPNFIHLLMASNEEWVVPASLDARRFFVLNVSPARANDYDYFRAIWTELEAGGYGAMLHDLLHFDLTGFQVRRVPRTAALNEQRLLSLDTPTAWWCDVLHEGHVDSNGTEWAEFVPTEALYLSYSVYARKRHEYRLMDRAQLGKFLHSMGGRRERPVAHVAFGGRQRGYRFGTLANARAAFTAKTRLDIDWPD